MLGANRSMVQLILELRDKGVDVAVLVPKFKGELISILQRENIKYYQTWYKQIKDRPSVKAIIKYLLTPIGVYNALKVLKGESFDIIHSNSSVISIGKWIAIVKGAKHVWHLREFGDLDYGVVYPICSSWQRFMYTHTDAYIAISESIADHFKSVIDSSKLYTIYNGVLPPINKDSAHMNDNIQFVMVGIIDEGKNQLMAIHAAKILLSRQISNFRLSIVGSLEDPSGKRLLYASRLIKFVEDNNLEDNVVFRGYCENVPQLLSGMDVGLMLSKSEAFGRTTIEYMMQNLAVIATSGGANKEIVSDGRNGILLSENNEETLADAMQHLIENRDYLKLIASCGKEDALSRFSSTRNSTEIYNLYVKLLS